jgi:hypothetical protein
VTNNSLKLLLKILFFAQVVVLMACSTGDADINKKESGSIIQDVVLYASGGPYKVRLDSNDAQMREALDTIMSKKYQSYSAFNQELRCDIVIKVLKEEDYINLVKTERSTLGVTYSKECWFGQRTVIYMRKFDPPVSQSQITSVLAHELYHAIESHDHSPCKTGFVSYFYPGFPNEASSKHPDWAHFLSEVIEQSVFYGNETYLATEEAIGLAGYPVSQNNIDFVNSWNEVLCKSDD